MINDINNLNVNELWALYASVLKRLKDLSQIRSNNITGERGEFLAIEFYSSNPNLPNLQLAPVGTQNIDAISRNGDRYSIKTVKSPNKTTGVFYGLEVLENPESNKKFEYLIVVILEDNYQLKGLVEISWNIFWKYKKWHSRMKAFNISLSKNLLSEAKTLYWN